MSKREVIRFTGEDISNKVKELGYKISQDYLDSDFIMIGLLRGSFIFLADIVREIGKPIVVDFITTSSYENSEVSNGTVKILSDIRENIENKDVLLIDDIMDSGNTLKYVKEYIMSKKPKSVKTCVLLDKPSRREVEITPDYVGFTIDDWFIVGYGLNYGDKYRNLPYMHRHWRGRRD